MNLLDETIIALSENGRSLFAVLWVGTADVHFSWDEFVALADTEYDSGFGGTNVADDLLVVGSDWCLELHEYDGSEWWEYKTLPTKPPDHHIPRFIVREQARAANEDINGYDLAGMNGW
jgi:hypothetical protein